MAQDWRIYLRKMSEFGARLAHLLVETVGIWSNVGAFTCGKCRNLEQCWRNVGEIVAQCWRKIGAITCGNVGIWRNVGAITCGNVVIWRKLAQD